MGTWTLRAIRDQGLRVGFFKDFLGGLEAVGGLGFRGSGVLGFRGLGV